VVKLANCPSLKGRKFRVIMTVTKQPISDKVGDYDEAYNEMEDFMSSQGCHPESVDIVEVLPVLRFFCDNADEKGNSIPDSGCGEIPNVVFDGYAFGDKLLEQVMFKAWPKDGEVFIDTVEDWDNDAYLKGLNKEHWCSEAKKYHTKLD